MHDDLIKCMNLIHMDDDLIKCMLLGHFIMSPFKLFLVRELFKNTRARNIMEEIPPSAWLPLSDTTAYVFYQYILERARRNSDLYSAKSKFDSGCGWPAYSEGIPGAIKELPDADGVRIEIVCSTCNSHLGHVFKGEGFATPTNERHCVNGICLKYEPA